MPVDAGIQFNRRTMVFGGGVDVVAICGNCYDALRESAEDLRKVAS